MLKVKDGIPLEELEKFGFEYKPCGADGYDFERYEKGNMFIDVFLRKIVNTAEEDTLYDLITAGIVVKE